MEELNEQEQEILKKVMAGWGKQPTHRLKILAVMDAESGETKVVKSHQVGNNPPETQVKNLE